MKSAVAFGGMKVQRQTRLAVDRPTGKSANPSPKNSAKPRNGNRPGANDPIGHQIRITQPQASLTPPGR